MGFDGTARAGRLYPICVGQTSHFGYKLDLAVFIPDVFDGRVAENRVEGIILENPSQIACIAFDICVMQWIGDRRIETRKVDKRDVIIMVDQPPDPLVTAEVGDP